MTCYHNSTGFIPMHGCYRNVLTDPCPRSLSTHTQTHFMSAECKSLQYFHFFIQHQGWGQLYYHVKSAKRAEKCSYSLHTCYILCFREKDLPQL